MGGNLDEMNKDIKFQPFTQLDYGKRVLYKQLKKNKISTTEIQTITWMLFIKLTFYYSV